MKKVKNIESIAETQEGHYILLVIESMIVGMLAGIVIVFFRKAILIFSSAINYLFNTIFSEDSVSIKLNFYIFLVIGILLASALVIGFLIKRYPSISGSGISQLKGNFLQKIPFLPIMELPLKFIAGILTIGSGMSVGSAGPAVQLGAYLGSIFEKIGKTSHTEKVCLITSGATAGLAAIFGTPFAGILFAIEGLHQYLTPLLLSCIICGSFAGNFTSSLFFVNKPFFDFSNLAFFPMKYYLILVLLGVLSAILAKLFKKSIYIFEQCFSKIQLIQLRPLIPFLLIPLIYFLIPLATGSGYELVSQLTKNNFSLKFLCILLTVKIIFTGICLGSGLTGGVFFPTLTCGALSGIIFANILVHFNLMESQYTMNLMIFAMAGFFTGVLQTPITGIILLAEIGSDFTHLEGILICTLTAYVVSIVLENNGNISTISKNLEFIKKI